MARRCPHQRSAGLYRPLGVAENPGFEKPCVKALCEHQIFARQLRPVVVLVRAGLAPDLVARRKNPCIFPHHQVHLQQSLLALSLFSLIVSHPSQTPRPFVLTPTRKGFLIYDHPINHQPCATTETFATTNTLHSLFTSP